MVLQPRQDLRIPSIYDRDDRDRPYPIGLYRRVGVSSRTKLMIYGNPCTAWVLPRLHLLLILLGYLSSAPVRNYSLDFTIGILKEKVLPTPS